MSAIGSSPYWTHVSKTVTLYGGVLEQITVDGNNLVTTNSDGSVTTSVPYGTHTYKGSVSGQSFERNVTKDTTDVYVMPEGDVAYWFGYSIITTTWDNFVTYNTNYLEIKNTVHNDGLNKDTNYVVSNKTVAHTIATINCVSGSVTGLRVGSKDIVSYDNYGYSVSTPTHKTTDISSISDQKIIMLAYSPNQAALNTWTRIYAVWFE